MQDLSTGELKQLDPKFFEGMEKLTGFEQRQRLQAAADQAIPDRRNQGPVFFLGEEIEIRGGRFKVLSINEKKNTITFESLPR